MKNEVAGIILLLSMIVITWTVSLVATTWLCVTPGDPPVGLTLNLTMPR